MVKRTDAYVSTASRRVLASLVFFPGFCSAPQALYILRQIRPSVCLSVCLSVRPSDSDIVSKRGNAEGCGLYQWVAQCPQCLVPRLVDGDDPV